MQRRGKGREINPWTYGTLGTGTIDTVVAGVASRGIAEGAEAKSSAG